MSTTVHLELMVDLIGGHTWETTAPASVHNGPIPDVVDYPAVGVFASGGDVVDETLDGIEMIDRVDVTIASPQPVDGEVSNQTALLEMMGELIKLIYNNPYLGDESVVRSTTFKGWDRTIVAFERDMGDQEVFQYLTVSYDVRYAVVLT